MKVFIGSDHAGYNLKTSLKAYLTEKGFQTEDLGIDNAEVKSDYPDSAKKVGEAVAAEVGSRGILVCGSGVGVCIAANKVNGIRAVNIYNDEVAKMSRLHNNANVACFGERMIAEDVAKEAVMVFLTTEFEGGRHEARVEKISQMEK